MEGMGRRGERKRKERGEMGKGEAVVTSSEERGTEKEREDGERAQGLLALAKGREAGSEWSLSLKGTGYPGDRPGQQITTFLPLSYNTMVGS